MRQQLIAEKTNVQIVRKQVKPIQPSRVSIRFRDGGSGAAAAASCGSEE